ncbi:MAG: hypothetical protein ACRDQA_24460, partial [Nocardioidaceae bacterium]
ETSLPPVAPAIGNAVYRATGIRITDLPITPDKLLTALHTQHEDREPAPTPAASVADGGVQ